MDSYIGCGPLTASVDMRLQYLREGTHAMKRMDTRAYKVAQEKYRDACKIAASYRRKEG